jgi:hypothetical protein
MLGRDRVCGRRSWRVDDVALGQVKDRAAAWVAWFMLAIFAIGCAIALTLAVVKGGFDPDTLVSDPVAEAIRKELWRQTGHRVDTAEIVRLLSDTLLGPSGLQGSA